MILIGNTKKANGHIYGIWKMEKTVSHFWKWTYLRHEKECKTAPLTIILKYSGLPRLLQFGFPCGPFSDNYNSNSNNNHNNHRNHDKIMPLQQHQAPWVPAQRFIGACKRGRMTASMWDRFSWSLKMAIWVILDWVHGFRSRKTAGISASHSQLIATFSRRLL